MNQALFVSLFGIPENDSQNFGQGMAHSWSMNLYSLHFTVRICKYTYAVTHNLTQAYILLKISAPECKLIQT